MNRRIILSLVEGQTTVDISLLLGDDGFCDILQASMPMAEKIKALVNYVNENY
ncbi:MAG: hypothetical protein ACO21G_05775 [Algoriphagus sp.]|jgi:hypothetical protein